MNKNIPKFEYGFYWESRRECFLKFGDLFSLPIIDNPYKEIAASYVSGNVLDLGAGKDLLLFNVIKEKLKDGRYYSLDNDPKGKFNFNSIEDIPNDLFFSLIVANQYFEHLDIQEAVDQMFNSAKLLRQGGKIIVTIPNILHPTRFFGDITHKTTWNYYSFYMVYKYADLDVTKISRYSKRHPKGFIEKLITKYTSRIYRMDWCDSILMVGAKDD